MQVLFDFHATKCFNTLEGAVCTDDDELAQCYINGLGYDNGCGRPGQH